MVDSTIFVVDDDSDLRNILIEQLEMQKEFKILQTGYARKAVEIAKTSAIDLIIMDISLPDGDGRDAVKILRSNGFKAPIIMLTEQNTDSDTVLGLESGANDYVTKPFRFSILLARIRAQLRQYEQSEDAIFRVGSYIFKPGRKILIDAENTPIRLTEKEAAIIKYLYRTGGSIVSRDELLEEVWGYNSGVTTHTLETHVYRLRQKIEKDPSNAQILITEGGGYKLAP